MGALGPFISVFLTKSQKLFSAKQFQQDMRRYWSVCSLFCRCCTGLKFLILTFSWRAWQVCPSVRDGNFTKSYNSHLTGWPSANQLIPPAWVINPRGKWLKVILLPCTSHVIAQYNSRRGQEIFQVKHLTVKGPYCVSCHLPQCTFAKHSQNQNH